MTLQFDPLLFANSGEKVFNLDAFKKDQLIELQSHSNYSKSQFVAMQFCILYAKLK